MLSYVKLCKVIISYYKLILNITIASSLVSFTIKSVKFIYFTTFIKVFDKVYILINNKFTTVLFYKINLLFV